MSEKSLKTVNLRGLTEKYMITSLTLVSIHFNKVQSALIPAILQQSRNA